VSGGALQSLMDCGALGAKANQLTYKDFSPLGYAAKVAMIRISWGEE